MVIAFAFLPKMVTFATKLIFMAKTSDLSQGNFIRFNGELMKIVELQHRTPGNLRAFYQAVMRNVRTGRQLENRFRPDEEVDLVRVEMRTMQYLYREGEDFICMDNDTYEQIPVAASIIGDAAKYIKENTSVDMAFNGDDVIFVQPPKHVELEVTYTEPGVRGDTATRTLKPAKVETGAEVMIPLFVNTGEIIRVDTTTGEYMERVK
jgi:elongation factor P